ncbi:MAG: M42 family metallopeptidase [Bacteroidetes bacterium]|nr:M42 family metallopeptidase [Bacteroidota bacterium]
MGINIQLLKEICEVPGAPGHEQPIREVVLRELKKLDVSVSIDNMGNVVALRKGKNDKKVMVAAHMDEIAFIVNHIDDNGFLRFIPLGGFDPKTLTAQRVIVHGKKDIIGVMGSKPIHVMSAEERSRVVPISDYFIDLGMKKKEVDKIVSVGDVVTRQRELIEMGDCVNCKSIDNRVSVFILIETLRELKKSPYDFYAVFTVQEEVGIRGAQVSALKIQPDFGFGLDTTIAYDVPDSKPQERCTYLGKGTAIKVMDSSTICDYRMVKYMKKTADKHKIKWQYELLPAGGTDTAGIQRMTAGGAICGAVSIPTRHIHQVIEMADKSDIRASIDLLKHSIQDLDTYDWSFK